MIRKEESVLSNKNKIHFTNANYERSEFIMRKNRRVLCGILAVITLTMVLPYLCPHAEAHSFTDISYGNPYFDAVNYCYDNDLVVGITDTQFGPDQDLNRAMFITFLYRMAGEPYVTGDTGFTDVPEGRYFTDAVRWGVQKGIISGMTNTQFAPFYPLNQEMVVTFLYRFARDIRGYTVETSNGLPSSVSSSVSNYAKVSMYWASRNGVVYLSDELAPKVTVTRGEAVRYLWRFGTNVDGIIMGTDAFCFVNDTSSFNVKDHCGMISTHYSKLVSLLTWEEKATVDDYISSQMAGSGDGTEVGMCYGMSVCAILDKMGKIDLNGNYCKNTATIHAIPKPSSSSPNNIMGTERISQKRISLTESVINYYQVCRWLPNVVGYTAFELDVVEYLTGSRHSNNLENLHAEQENGGLGLFSYEINGSGLCHTIVVYGRPVSTSDQINGKPCYTYRAYDSRTPWTNGTIYVSKDFTMCKVENVAEGVLENATMVRFFVENEMFGDALNGPKLNDDNNFSTFDAVDIDGANNSGINSISAEVMRSREENVLQEYAFFYVQADGPFTVTNAEGKHFHCECDGITGDMAAALVNMFPGDPGILLFRVPRSESFIFETQASSINVRYVTDGDFKTFCGQNLEKVVLERDSLELSGSSMNYRASTTVNTEDYLSANVSGAGEELVLLFRKGDQLQIQTTQTACAVEIRDFNAGVSIETQTYQLGQTVSVAVVAGSPTMTVEGEMRQ